MTKKCLVFETLGNVKNLQIQESSNDNEVRLSGVFGVCGIKSSTYAAWGDIVIGTATAKKR